MNRKEGEKPQGYIEIMRKRSKQEILKVWLSELKNYESKIVYFGVLLLGFSLYTLAYVFFYGFYFGRNSDDIMSVIQVVINPVPFNFKSLTMLGLFLVVVFAVFINILQKITDSLNKRSMLIIFDLLMLIILIICAQTAITLVFMGEPSLNLKYFGIWIFVSVLIIYSALTASSKFIEIGYGFMGGIVITCITLFLNVNFKFKMGPEFFLGILFGGWFLLAILLVYINIKKWIINCFIYLVAYFFVEIIIKFNVISFNSLLTAIIILIVLIVVNILNKKHLLSKVLISKSNENEKLKIKHNKLENFLKLIIGRYKFILVPIFISGVIFYSYFLIFTLGREMSKNILKTSYYIISYKAIDPKNQTESLIGIVVSQTDNILYISNKNRELIMIKKNSDVEIRPTEGK